MHWTVKARERGFDSLHGTIMEEAHGIPAREPFSFDKFNSSVIG